MKLKKEFKPLETKEKEDKKEIPVKEQSSDTKGVAMFISYLQSCQTVVKRMHWNTKFYADHKNLDKLFDGLLDVTDSIAEKASGYLGKNLSEFTDEPAAKYQNMEPIKYLKDVKEYIQKDRYVHFPKDYTPIQNEIDSLVNLIDNTLYLLRLQ